jgi:alpha-L-fucosidase
MKIIIIFAGIFLNIFFVSINTHAQSKEQTLEWFRNAKFGMFIHWGTYAEIGRNEWARANYKMSIAEYQKYIDRFNPVSFNPDDWFELANDAGMKYMVFTSKHHDGFCMFDTKLTDYSIMKNNYGKDIVGMVKASSDKYNMPLGLYYSIREWHHPDYIQPGSWADRFEGLEKAPSKHPDSPNLNRYMEFVKGQLKELVTQYDPYVIWFDGTSQHTLEELGSYEISDYLKSLKPEMLHNNRIFPKNIRLDNPDTFFGDFLTPERSTPTSQLLKPDGTLAPWEACNATQFHAWGYNRYETQFHTVSGLIQTLASVVSKGGNLLLNVGPKPDGTIRGEDIIRLKAIGDWLKINGEAIYGTEAGHFNLLPFYGKSTVKDNMVYIHVFEWPEDKILRLPGLKSEIKKVYFLADKNKSVGYKRSGNDVLINLPDRPYCEAATVLALELNSPVDIEKQDYILPQPSGIIKLPVHNAEITSIGTIKGYLEHDIATNQTAFVNWKQIWTNINHKFIVEDAGNYTIKLVGSDPGVGSKYMLTINDEKIEGVLKSEDRVTVGNVTLNQGEHNIRLQFPEIKGAEAFRLKEIILEQL